MPPSPTPTPDRSFQHPQDSFGDFLAISPVRPAPIYAPTPVLAPPGWQPQLPSFRSFLGSLGEDERLSAFFQSNASLSGDGAGSGLGIRVTPPRYDVGDNPQLHTQREASPHSELSFLLPPSQSDNSFAGAPSFTTVNDFLSPSRDNAPALQASSDARLPGGISFDPFVPYESPPAPTVNPAWILPPHLIHRPVDIDSDMDDDESPLPRSSPAHASSSPMAASPTMESYTHESTMPDSLSAARYHRDPLSSIPIPHAPNRKAATNGRAPKTGAALKGHKQRPSGEKSGSTASARQGRKRMSVKIAADVSHSSPEAVQYSSFPGPINGPSSLAGSGITQASRKRKSSQQGLPPASKPSPDTAKTPPINTSTPATPALYDYPANKPPRQFRRSRLSSDSYEDAKSASLLIDTLKGTLPPAFLDHINTGQAGSETVDAMLLLLKQKLEEEESGSTFALGQASHIDPTQLLQAKEEELSEFSEGESGGEGSEYYPSPGRSHGHTKRKREQARTLAASAPSQAAFTYSTPGTFPKASFTTTMLLSTDADVGPDSWSPVYNAHVGLPLSELSRRIPPGGAPPPDRLLLAFAGKLDERGQNLEVFRCYIAGCGQTNKRRDHIVTHVGSHVGVRPFGCSHCPNRFFRRNECKRHELQHTGARAFTCLLCKHENGMPRTFARQDLMTRHLKRTHGMTPGPQMKACFTDSQDMGAEGKAGPSKRVRT